MITQKEDAKWGYKLLRFVSSVGITNHEEYSLVRELPEEEKMKTLTLKRDKSIAKDQKKLDEMKKKLHTDDECKYIYIDYFIHTC